MANDIALRRFGGVCLYVAVTLLLVPYLLVPAQSPDLWLHLKTGAWIMSHGIPHADPFSYTKFGQPWIDHEWLFQLIVAQAHRWGGEAGLMTLSAGLLATIILLVLRICRRLPPLVTLALTGTAIMLLNLRSALTPELVSLLCFLLACRCLEARRRHPAMLWWLVPLQLFWSNVHGFAMLGWLLTVWVFCGEFVLLRHPYRWWSAEGADRRTLRRLSIIVMLQGAMLACTPYGWKSLGYPATAVASFMAGGKRYIGFVEELLSFADVAAWRDFAAFALMALAGAVTFLSRRYRFDIGLAVPFLLSALVGGWIFRQVGFFALLAVCTIAWNLDEDWRPRTRRSRACVQAMVALGLVLVVHEVWVYSRFHGRAVRISTRAVDYLAEHPLPGEVFNTFNYGAYLIFRCAPERRVFVDGRTEFYGPQFLRQTYTAAALDAATWQQTGERHHIRTALLGLDEREGHFLARRLYRDPQWQIAYLDPKAIIMVHEQETAAASNRRERIHQWLPDWRDRAWFWWQMGDRDELLRDLSEERQAHPQDPAIERFQTWITQQRS